MVRPLRVATALTLLAVPALAGQAAREVEDPSGALALSASAPLPARPGGEVAAAYRVRLVSDWPQYGQAASGCANGGEEVLRGTLTRTAEGRYAGHLERRTTILFCGTHGAAQGAACSLTLTSHGPVLARAVVLPGEAPGVAEALALRWSSAASAPAEDIAITGNCAPAFMASLRTLYHGVSHAVEIPLPRAGTAPAPVRLEQGWIAEVE